jgi:hypothetical protein
MCFLCKCVLIPEATGLLENVLFSGTDPGSELQRCALHLFLVPVSIPLVLLPASNLLSVM